MNHTGFIVAAYIVAGILLGGMIVASVLDYRRQKQRLAERDVVEGEERP